MGNQCNCQSRLQQACQEVELYINQFSEYDRLSTAGIQKVPESKLLRHSKFQRPSTNWTGPQSNFTKEQLVEAEQAEKEIDSRYGKMPENREPRTDRKIGTSVKKAKPLTMNDYKKFKYIDNIESKYLLGKFLGKGAFGTVRRCTRIETANEFAIKIMQKSMVRKRKIYVKLLENELSILGSKSHPKIIRIVDLMEDELNYYVVSELVEGGELFKRLCQLESFTEVQAVNIIQQVMLGLNYLHLQQITHRDLKPENILLVSKDPNNFDIKISDLGFAQEFDKDGRPMTLVLGSPLYMAPELVQNQPYNEKVDVWSLGVITYQLLSGRTPFESRALKKIDQKIMHKKISFANTDHEYWDDIS